MVENINYHNLKAKTLRYQKTGNEFIFSGESPNCGLLCYLCESMLNSNIDYSPYHIDIINYSNEVFEEARFYKEKYFWGWEKRSSIPNVYFPFDWDDTSKALDFLFLASRKKLINLNKKLLPDDDLWEIEIRNSLFYSNSSGEDIKIDHKKYLALSVFFGPLSKKWAKRDDPMVTLALIRTTKTWFPKVFDNLNNEFIELLDKLIYLANHLMKYEIPFDRVSRYYFSFGHFLYRLIEILELLGYKHDNLVGSKMDENINQSAFNLRNKLMNHQSKSHEYLLWYLIGLKTKHLAFDELGPNTLLKNNFKPAEYIYRHRRLEHYYLAENWYKKLFFWEFHKLKNDIHINHSLKNSYLPTSYITSNYCGINL